jgi:hypothetical protein
MLCETDNLRLCFHSENEISVRIDHFHLDLSVLLFEGFWDRQVRLGRYLVQVRNRHQVRKRHRGHYRRRFRNCERKVQRWTTQLTFVFQVKFYQVWHIYLLYFLIIFIYNTPLFTHTKLQIIFIFLNKSKLKTFIQYKYKQKKDKNKLINKMNKLINKKHLTQKSLSNYFNMVEYFPRYNLWNW